MSVRNRKKPTKLNIPRLEQPLSPIQPEPQKNITGILKTTTPSANNTVPEFSGFRNDSTNTQSLSSLKRKWAGKKCHLPSGACGSDNLRGCTNDKNTIKISKTLRILMLFSFLRHFQGVQPFTPLSTVNITFDNRVGLERLPRMLEFSCDFARGFKF